MKDSNAEAVMKELKREIETMYTLNHPNIVRLLGITQSERHKIALSFPVSIYLSLHSPAQHFLTFIGQFPMVVMEFVENGSLRDYLSKLRRGKTWTPRTHQVLLRFSQQIANGMSYLVNPGFPAARKMD